MVCNKVFVIAVIAIVMTVSFQQAVALKCWTCSSDSVRPNVQNQYCKDPFDAENISDVDKERSYKECIPTADQSHNHNAYCRKLTQTVKNATVIFRSCYFKPANAPKDQCFDAVTVSFIKNEHCQICEKDGCNAAAQFGPLALFIVIPMAIAKILML